MQTYFLVNVVRRFCQHCFTLFTFATGISLDAQNCSHSLFVTSVFLYDSNCLFHNTSCKCTKFIKLVFCDEVNFSVESTL